MRPLDKLESQQHDQIKRNAEIARNEILVIEGLLFTLRIVHKDVEIFEDGDDDAECEREVGPIEAKRRHIR